MQEARTLLRETQIPAPGGDLTLSLDREDFSAVYPGMLRYTIRVVSGSDEKILFVTNSYEYAPRVPLTAEEIAYGKFVSYAQELTNDPSGFFQHKEKHPVRPHTLSGADCVVIQGSPRADGNCSVFAEWTREAVQALGKTTQIIYPHDLDIHPCIGCYQCYNTGTCTFEDDMGDIISAIRACQLLVVCAPVYTNSVPGTTKTLIDRCQAYHAERLLYGRTEHQKGLLCAVAGRKGNQHFTCVGHVVHAFMRNLGILPSGDILVDGMDEHRDIRRIPELKHDVQAHVQASLLPAPEPQGRQSQ
ncbi:MAG: flavodoxin family protein [Methanoregula sp.]|nr:flavodoxin family protein [Methanoregula sp.]